MRSSVLSVALAALALHLGTGAGVFARQEAEPAPATRYRVSAVFDPANRAIAATARIEWKNISAGPVSDLRLVTPWNSRADDRSSWSRERQVTSDKGQAAPGPPGPSRGTFEISAVSLLDPAGDVDASSKVAAIAPDDGNVDDRTVWSLPLEPALGPGRSVEIEVRWTARFPALEDGFGVNRNFFLAAHWIPRVGQLATDGWHAHQTHDGLLPGAEFGRYDLDLRLPTGWRVGATGRQTSARDNGNGTTSLRFEAENTPDFAWVASLAFAERIERIELPGGRAVDVHLLMQPEHMNQSGRHLNAAKVTLEKYTEWFGPYPWPSLTIADVPQTGSSTESPDASRLVASHPGIVAVKTPWMTPWASGSLDTAVVTGVGDQYWTAAVGADRAEHAWMGAGLSNYVSDRVSAESFGGRFGPVKTYFGGLATWAFNDARFARSASARQLLRTASAPGTESLGLPAWRRPVNDRTLENGARTPLAFLTLERLLGWDIARTTLSTHLRRGSFHHPTPSEFRAFASSAANRNIAWFFDAALKPGLWFDYSVDSVSSTPVAGETWESDVVLNRLGNGVFPVDVLVSFDDGASVMERWDGAAVQHTLRYNRNAAVASVEIDPDQVLALDVNRIDNSWTSRPRAREAAAKWSRRWASWFQHLLVTYAFLV